MLLDQEICVRWPNCCILFSLATPTCCLHSFTDQINTNQRARGHFKIYTCHLTSIGIPIIKIKWSHDHLIFIMAMFIPEKMVYILRQDTGCSDFDRSASCVFYAKKSQRTHHYSSAGVPGMHIYSSKWNTFIIISLYPFANILPEVIFLKFIQYLQRCIQLKIS